MFKTVILSTVILLTFFSTACFALVLDCNGGRYEDNGDGTVTDCKSGLIWLKNANCTDTVGGIVKTNGYLTWADAQKWVKGLADGAPGPCGLTDGSSVGDWRLPTKSELMAMVDSAITKGYTNPALTDASGTAQCLTGCIFNNVSTSYYWTYTSYPTDITSAFVLWMSAGTPDYSSKSSNSLFVWPVRGGQAGSFGSLTIQ